MIKFVRDNQLVWPYCSECGCRLEILKLDINSISSYTASHFGPLGPVDARGCSCKYVNTLKFVPNWVIEAVN